MRVYDLNLTGTQAGATGAERTQETRQTGRTGASGGGAAAGRSDGDRVEFSNTLGRLSNALTAEDPGRAAKVQQLSAQYQAGGYQPNAAGTSRGLVSEALAG